MGIIITGSLCIIFAIGFFFINKYTKFNKLPYVVKQIVFGTLFGAIACLATVISYVDAELFNIDTPPNIRDAAPITAGIVFGGPAGIIAGIIGGVFRLFVGGTATQIACSIATIFAGLLPALLRNLLINNNRTSIFYSIWLAIVCEVFHMLIIFISFQTDASTAFDLIRTLTLPMVLSNAFIVGIIVFIIKLVNKEKIFLGKQKTIAYTFQKWLILSILIAYVVTSSYTYFLQTSIAKRQTINSINLSITDIKNDIADNSYNQMLQLTTEIKNLYYERTLQYADQGKKNKINLEDAIKVIETLKEEYNVSEINIINISGIIFASTNANYIGYDMQDDSQSNDFFAPFAIKDHYVQEFMPISYDQNILCKYAGYKIVYPEGIQSRNDEYIVQVGIDKTTYIAHLSNAVEKATENRHIGIQDPSENDNVKGGFVVICSSELDVITPNNQGILTEKVEEVGFLNIKNQTSGQLYKTEIVIDEESDETEEYYYSFIRNEGRENFYVIGAIPVKETMYSRDSAMYISTFMQIIVFNILFVVVFFLIKKLVINNLNKINNKLEEITEGNLNVVVDVQTNEEFSSLSEDINITVNTLKNYIAEAEARIDKELEYAKAIQNSALPRDLLTSVKKGRFDIFATMIAAKEVGGDFYDFYMLDDDNVAFLVADVSGKGIPAAMFMMTAKTIIKNLAETRIEVNDIFTKANEKLCENNESGMFVTAWMGILNLKTGVFKFANAGHNPPIILHDNNEFEYLKYRPGLVLAGMDGIRYRAGEMVLSAGDRIFLYTDGVTEATNANLELYGEDRLLKFMNDNKDIKHSNLLKELKSDIDLFVGDAPQFDDITMLLFTYNSSVEGGTTEKVFNAEDSELENVLGFIEEELEKVECPIKLIMGMTVAIEEVFVNVSHYAYPNSEGKVKFRFAFNEQTREITIKMIDTGIPFNPLNKADPDITLSAEERQIGGLGIFITKKTMDEVSYEYKDNQNILIMKKKI